MGLPYPVFAWSSTGNYPVGSFAWSSQPVAVQPAGVFFTPGTFPAAEEFNYNFGHLYADALLLRAYVAPRDWKSATNFNVWSAALSSPLGFEACCWDQWNLQWIVATNTGPGILVSKTYGKDTQGVVNDANWPQVNSASLSSIVCSRMGIFTDPNGANTYHLLWTNDDGTHNGKIYYSFWNTSFWAATTQPITVTSGATDIQTVEMCSVGTNVCAAIGNTNTSAGSTGIWYYPNGGPSWTLCTGTQAVNGVPWWYIKSNGLGLAIAMPGQMTGSSNTKYFTSTDGVTWTQRTLSVQGANDMVVGLAWGLTSFGGFGATPAWLMATFNTVTLQTTFYYSTDGILWNGMVTKPVKVVDMAAQDSLIMCALAEPSSAAGSACIYSIDGGVTWYFASAGLANSWAPTLGWYQHPHMYSGPTQFLHMNNGWLRFSDVAGLPPLAL